MNSHHATWLPNSKIIHLGYFHTSRKGSRKLLEAIWLTVINEIFNFPTHLHPFGYVSYLYELSSGYQNYPFQKWYIWASFQTIRKRFRKLEKSLNSHHRGNPSLKWAVSLKFVETIRDAHFKNDTLGLVSSFPVFFYISVINFQSPLLPYLLDLDMLNLD